MTNLAIPLCPLCSLENTYPDGDIFICPDCSHEWSANGAHCNILSDGDTVTLIKDRKVKGSSLVIKGGTKIKNIRLTTH